MIRSDAKEGLRRLKTGDFNSLSGEKHPDGSEVITLSSEKYPDIYRFTVRNLYQENEEVLDNATGKFIPTRDLQEALPEVPGGTGETGEDKGGG
jgi:hypothetical protein